MLTLRYSLVGFLVLLLCCPAFAQEKTVIGTVDGIEISYEVQLLETKERKNPSKSRDIYRIVGYVTNKSGQDLYTTSATPFRVEVNNATGLTKAATPTPQRTNYQALPQGNEPGGTLFLLKDGVTFQNDSKLRVPKGMEPIVNYDKNGIIKPLKEWSLQLNGATVNGNWVVESSNQIVTFQFNESEQTITQRNQGNTIVWYASASVNGTATNVYERSFQGVGVTGDPNPRDGNAIYKATLTLVAGNRLMYRNTEGVTIYYSKQ